MKYLTTILFSLIFHFSIAQSVEILPSLGQTNGNLKLKKDGIGLNHSNSNETVSIGTYASSSGAFLQTHTNHPLYFTTNNGSARLTLGINGYFGIGTTTPQHPLTFPNQLGDKISLWGGNTNATNGHYGIGIQNSLLQFYSAGSTDDIAFGHGRSGLFTENLRIKGTGNVGIGTNNPQNKLHVVGGIRSSSLAGSGVRNVGADSDGNLVITSIGSYSNIAFSGYKESLNVFNNSEKEIDLLEYYDLGNNLNLTINGSIFDVPASGIYHFSINIYWQGNANGERSIILRDQDGIFIREFTDFPPNAQTFRQVAFCDLQLVAGTSVRFYLKQTSGTSLTSGVSTFKRNEISCFKVD